MHTGSFFEVSLQRSIQHHPCVLERRVVNKPVHLSAHGRRGVEAVFNAGAVDVYADAIDIAQLNAGGVNVKLAGYEFANGTYSFAVVSYGFEVNSSGYTLATKIPRTPCIRQIRWIKCAKSELKVRIFTMNTAP